MRIQADRLREFARALLVASGTDDEQAAKAAEILVWCDLVGRSGYGVWRLPNQCKRVKLGLVKCPCRPNVEERTESLCTMDGDNGLGYVVSAVAMERAVAMARRSGVGVVAVRNSNFFGAAGYFVNQAAEAGMIGLAMSNSFPKVAALGGRKPAMGTNPFAFGAPRSNGRHLIIDMATSGVAGSLTRKLVERHEPLPEGHAIDAEGRPITDPSKVDQGVLLPFGGPKGYCWALMVEVLSGVLTGAGIAHGVNSMYKNFREPGNNGHLVAAVDIRRLMPLTLWNERMDYLVSVLRASGLADGDVLYPGEHQWDAYAANVKSGPELDAPMVEALTALAKELGVATPW